jgi:hypothetical protein
VNSAWSAPQTAAPSDADSATPAGDSPAGAQAPDSSESAAPRYGTAPVAQAESAPAAAEATSAKPQEQAVEDEPEAPVERTARRRRHGKVVRPAGAPAPVSTPAVDIAVPPVPEGQSRVLTAPEASSNGHEVPGDNAVADVVAAEVDGPDVAALPRRHQPRRAVSRPAGPPVNTPGEPS